jgi:ParB-like chromosome segregation protein Spo0J
MPEVMNLAQRAELLFREIDDLPLSRKVEAINRIRQHLHNHSPFAEEPVDCVQWVPVDEVEGNDYNPNTVAPPEMRLLTRSIEADGFTQPVVSHQDRPQHYEVVDGFHRQRVASRADRIRRRLSGYLPIVLIRGGRNAKPDRIAATIRHNRARGVHAVPPMTDIVVSLLQAGWSDGEVARELGMDEDEVLRFKQVSGLPGLFRDQPYSKAWE